MRSSMPGPTELAMRSRIPSTNIARSTARVSSDCRQTIPRALRSKAPPVWLEADGPEAHVDLTQNVRDPGVSIAPADIDDPLPKHRRIDERLAPEHVAYKRPANIAETSYRVQRP
jgi:hypothetical protein